MEITPSRPGIPTSSLTPRQCRGARAMLGWSREFLAVLAGVSARTITDLERGAREPHLSTRRVVAAALRKGGIELTDEGRGVRMRADR